MDAVTESSPLPPAASAAPANPWLKGPPPQLKPQDEHETGDRAGNNNLNALLPLPPPPAPVVLQPVKAGRVHHTLPLEEARVHAFQLGVAQQMAMGAMQSGVDLPTYQAQLAMTYGYDPRLLNITPEPGTRLTGNEPPLGLTLVRDDQAYSHIELLSRYPHLTTINLTAIDPEPRRASFFLVTCLERQVHASIKYGYWTIPSEGANAINKTFGEMHAVGPVYFLFASTDSVAFSGIAQMVGPAQPVVPLGDGAESTAPTQYRIPVRWIFCKNIPFSYMQHVALRPSTNEAEEARKAHGGLQPMRHVDGTRALSIFARYIAGVSVLMDFKYYDDAEARGIAVESGDAAVKAAQKLQQKFIMQHQNAAARSMNQQQHQPRRHYHHNQQHGQNHQSSGNAKFPTPAQAQSGSKPYEKSGQASTGANQQHRQHRGDNNHQSRSNVTNVRKVLTADEDKINLTSKYVFEPVVKTKQKDRRRKNRNDESEHTTYYEDAPETYEQPSQQEYQAEEQPHEEEEE